MFHTYTPTIIESNLYSCIHIIEGEKNIIKSRIKAETRFVLFRLTRRLGMKVVHNIYNMYGNVCISIWERSLRRIFEISVAVDKKDANKATLCMHIVTIFLIFLSPASIP